MTENRCRKEFTIGERPASRRQACCWRPVWEDTDRCKWHLDRDKGDILVRPLHIEVDAHLQESIFRGASLTGEEALAERELQRCDFSETDLRDADLRDADLQESTFENADLRGATLSGADIRDVDFTGADVRDADVSEVDARGANFERANLEKASFIRSNLRDASIRDAKLYEVLFSDTWINEGTDLGWQCIYESDPSIVPESGVVSGGISDKPTQEQREENEGTTDVDEEERDTERPEDEGADAEGDSEDKEVRADGDAEATGLRRPAERENHSEETSGRNDENAESDGNVESDDTEGEDDSEAIQPDVMKTHVGTSESDETRVRRNDAAAWTYRALEQLCRENALPAKTRWFYIREKDARRKQEWASGNYTSALKSEVSRWVMEYGSNPWRIIGVSLLVIIGWAFLYPLTGGLTDTATGNTFGLFVETPVDAPRYYVTTVFLKSLYFSVVTFATLGYGDIIPVGGPARALATVETLLGSLLTALLVFVLSRIVTW